MDIYLFIFLLLAVAPISIFLHEAGHAAAGILLKAEYTYLIIGRGKKIFDYSSGTIHFKLYAVYFMGGYAKSERKMPFKRVEIIIISFFGPLVNCLMFLLCWNLLAYYPSHYMELLALFNLWLAAINVVPFKWKNKKSDGYNILKAMLR
ncbi:site-2 protease family protein [Oceanobacillus kapialis]|uniref:Site-2 protease family protein n=1 Tax=Oceanobacillus kapialis TaxID=481353 RepID=A0ABW5Q5S3_9BACI